MITSSDLGLNITTGYGKLFLKTAPSTTPVSLAEAKTHLRVTGSDDDTYITTLIDVATQTAEEFLNLKLMSQTWVLYLDEFPDYFDLLIGTLKTASIGGIKYYNDSNVLTTLADSNYFIDEFHRPARVYFADDFTIPDTFDRPNAVAVEFTLGFSTASNVPAPIRQAILLMIGTYYEIRQNVVTGTIATHIPQTSEFLLRQYRIQQ